MIHFIKYIYNFVIIMLFTMLTACGVTDDINTVSDVKTSSESETKVSKLESGELLPFSMEDTEGYMNYITNMPSFKPYYKTVFAFEMLPNGISSVPLEKVKSMYKEMKTAFDYIIVSEQPLFYRGYYDGETNFVEGYEQYQTADTDIEVKNPINIAASDWDGNKFMLTPLKTVMLGESIFNHFDNSIAKGRNLQMFDFTLEASDKPISVVLGSEYNGIYEIGDMISLELVSEIMNFQVVGFYKPGVSFSMDVAAQHQVI